MNTLGIKSSSSKKFQPGIPVEGRLPCPNCDSSDAFQVYQTPGTHPPRYYGKCFSCLTFESSPPGYHNSPDKLGIDDVKPNLWSKVQMSTASPTPKTSESIEDVLSDFLTYPIRAIPDRKITKETCEHYGVRVSLDERDGATIISHKYPYYKGRNLSGYKERIVDGKVIFAKGDVGKVGLFGSHVARPNAKTLFITEGELDCLALYQTLRSLSTLPDYQPSVVSLTHGAASAVKDISYDLEFVDSFEKIVLVFDQDDPGQQAQDEVCKLLAGKVFTASLSEKDPCDMVMAGKSSDLYWAVLKHARHYMPDSIVSYADGWDRYKNSRNQTSFPFPKAWKELNDKTYGARMGELIMVTSGSGMGGLTFSPFMW